MIEEIKHIKYLGKFGVTYEIVTYLLNLNRDLRFIDAYTEPGRQILNFVFESDRPVTTEGLGQTYMVGEGMEIPSFSVDVDAVIENMRIAVRDWDIAHGKLTNRQLITELKEDK